MVFGGEKLRWREAPKNCSSYSFELMEFGLMLHVELDKVHNALEL
jgi:hypothetical protein